MRAVFAALLLIASTGAWAQSTGVARSLLPGPASVILEVGRWVIQGREQVYEVTVQGIGRTQDEAHDQALRMAVSQAAGAIIFTETRVDRAEQELRRADLVNHSSGIVDRFEILRTGQDAHGRTTIDMRVWVRRGVLSNSLFGTQTNTTAIQGPQVAATLASESQQRRTSGPLVEVGLRGWPERAIRVEVKRHSWQTVSRDFASLTVDLDMSFDKDWYAQFYRTLSDSNGIQKNNPCNWDRNRCDGLMRVVLNVAINNGYRAVVAWNDSVNWTMIDRALMSQSLSVRVDLMGQGRRLYRQCFTGAQVRSELTFNPWFNLVAYEGAQRRFEWDPMPTGIDVRGFARQPMSIQIHNLSVDAIKGIDNLAIQVVKTPDCQ